MANETPNLEYDKIAEITRTQELFVDELRRLVERVTGERDKNLADIQAIKAGNWANEVEMLSPFLEIGKSLEDALQVFTTDLRNAEAQLGTDKRNVALHQQKMMETGGLVN